jgi:asparagine synthase (glutamine-hydrolysing)
MSTTYELPDIAANEHLLSELHKLAVCAVEANLGSASAIAYSGGIDSSILAKLASKLRRTEDLILVKMGMPGSRDLAQSEESCAGLRIESIGLSKNSVEEAAVEISQAFEIDSLSQLEDCVAFLLIGKAISRIGSYKAVLTANGPDELFCGYDRFRRIVATSGSSRLGEEMAVALETARKLQNKVSLILGRTNLSCKSPFLENKFAEFAKNSIPTSLKIHDENDLLRKRIWRTYGRYIGLDELTVLKRKRAMQYSMGIHSIVLKLLKQRRISIAPDFRPVDKDPLEE